MKISERGDFREYRVVNINEARKPVDKFLIHAEGKTTVFISHKHDDLTELKDIIGFLEKKYKVKTYVDSLDVELPKVTSGTTASLLKNRIVSCNKYILLATEAAIVSQWCNWELGYGDACKYSDHIALFPIKEKGEPDSIYKGKEYMSIYPSIVYYNGYDKYKSGENIPEGYYVRTIINEKSTINPLSNWFANIK